MKVSHVLSAFALAGTMLASAPVAAQDPITIRIATFLPPNGLFTGAEGVFATWGKQVEADSGGLVKVQIFPGGTLGAAGRDPSAQLKMVTDGVADMSFIIPTTTPGRFPDDSVFGLPAAENSLEASLAYWTLSQAGIMRGHKDDGFHVLGLCVNPPNTLHTKDAVTKLEDLKGLRLQSSGPEQQAIIRALGAAPIGTVSVRDVAEAISRGVVDGTLKDWIAVNSFRIVQSAFHHVDIPLGSATIMIAMNAEKYRSLPPKAKAAVDKNSGEALVRLMGTRFDGALAQNKEKIAKDSKHTIVALDAKEKARWDKAVEGVIADWRKQSPENDKLWAAYQKTLGEIRGGKRAAR
ncbi:MAG TPA: TRAP transporter substrate-binding protein [Xanthobacteraceae bacterium]|nr:TRAP transporter substrate-binding protein [Xanthobacteraceae bacterium]